MGLLQSMNPWGRALRAERAQAKLAKRAAYLLAQVNNITYKMGLTQNSHSADQIFTGDAPKLRRACRELLRNNEMIARAQDFWVDRVVGEMGFVPQVRTGSKRLNKDIEDEWKRFTDGGWWFELQKQWVREWFIVGESFTYVVTDGDGNLRFETFEPEELYGGSWRGDLRTGVVDVRDGVGYDAWDRPVEYYFQKYDSYRKAQAGKPQIIAADRVAHIFDKQRPSQSRGFSPVVQVGVTAHQIQDADTAELTGIQGAAYWGLALKPEGSTSEEFDLQYSGAEEDENAADTGVQDYQITTEPGGVNVYNGDVSLLDAKRPGSDYVPFTSTLAKKIAARLAVPYSALTGDTSGSNYSTERATAMYMKTQWRQMQRMVCEMGCKQAYRWWLEMQIVNPASKVRLGNAGTIDELMYLTKWQRNGFEWVDPKAETEAMEGLMRNGVASYSDVLAERGHDPQEMVDRIAADRGMLEDAELDLPESLQWTEGPQADVTVDVNKPEEPEEDNAETDEEETSGD